jgi:hypothetical protein
VNYLAWPEGADYAWVVGKKPFSLAKWKNVYRDMVVDEDIEDIQDLNMVQEAGNMIERGEVVHEVGGWAELHFNGEDGAAQRAALTLAAQHVSRVTKPERELAPYEPNTGGPFAMFNKNIEKLRRKFVAANALEMGDPLNMDYCYERSLQRMHCIRSQTKLAAQKFNGCSARGWVMLVHIPRTGNPTQVVWCLVWHTLKCILPQMQLFLPEDFSYSDGVKVDDPTLNDDLYTAVENQVELRESLRSERLQAVHLYQGLLRVTGIQHDAAKSLDRNMRELQSFMFIGELVAHCSNTGKGALHEATCFVNRFGVKKHNDPLPRSEGCYHKRPGLLMSRGAPANTYCVVKSPALDAWARVEAGDMDPRQEVLKVKDVLFAAAPVLIELYRQNTQCREMQPDPCRLDCVEKRHYKFGTVLDLDVEGEAVLFKATEFQWMLQYTKVICSSTKPARDEKSRRKNIPTWGAALRSWQRLQENTKIAGGGGHPQKQLWDAGLEYDYTKHYSLLKVMLLGAVPVVNAGGKNVFTTPQVMRTLGPEARGDSRLSFVNDVVSYVEGVRWTPVDGRNWKSFLGGLAEDAEGCGRRGSS